MGLLLAAAVMLVTLPSALGAGKFNITKSLQSPLVQTHDMPPGDGCTVPGVCVPVNQTIPGNTLWYWCGFWTTHRTIYNVTSLHATNTIAQQYLMRRSVLESCALANLNRTDECAVVPEGSCAKLKTCTARVFGLVLSSEMCLVIINTKSSSIVTKVQAWNHFDHPRYYGTVFVILITVVGLSAILAVVSYQFYVGIRSPICKHREPIRVRRAGEAAKEESDLKAGLIGDEEAVQGEGPRPLPDHTDNRFIRFVRGLRSPLNRNAHREA